MYTAMLEGKRQSTALKRFTITTPWSPHQKCWQSSVLLQSTSTISFLEKSQYTDCTALWVHNMNTKSGLIQLNNRLFQYSCLVHEGVTEDIPGNTSSAFPVSTLKKQMLHVGQPISERIHMRHWMGMNMEIPLRKQTNSMPRKTSVSMRPTMSLQPDACLSQLITEGYNLY